MRGDGLVEPIIQIYREGPEKYRVLVDGMEIKNLKSFSLKISNKREYGVIEPPHYTAEIYLPIKKQEPVMWNGIMVHADSMQQAVARFTEPGEKALEIEDKEE